MTNPNNAVGTNGAFGGRTSVNAFNDVMGAFQGRGLLSGWGIVPSSGMTVDVGGSGTVRDTAVSEDNAGNKTSINNISGSAISVTLNTAPASNSRYDAIVAYVDKPPMGNATQDNPECCGIIPVTGTAASTPSYPDDGAIRSAITADGASGSTAYYVVLGYVLITSGTTTITSGMITSGGMASVGTNQVNSGSVQDNAIVTNKIADGAVTSNKIDWTTLGVTLWSGDSHGTSIVLSEDPTNYKYLIFVFNSSSNGTANSTCKIPTGPSIRYTVSTPFMFENGGIAMDCVQYTASGTTLSVKYQGYAGIGKNGNTTVSQTTGIHILKVIGTDIDV